MSSQVRMRKGTPGPSFEGTHMTHLVDVPKKIAASISRTMHWNELEEWQKDNEYIVQGYRRIQNSWKGCLDSVFGYLHNETVNIHTHLWGATFFIYLLATFYPTYVSLHELTTWKDVAVMSIFLISAVFCLSASAFYHTGTCHSRDMHSRCRALDYSGIIILIVGSFYPSIYYGFYCDARFAQLYLIAMTLTGLGAASVVLQPKYGTNKYRGTRTAVFIGLGLCGAIPTIHLSLTHGFYQLATEMGAKWLLISAALYIAGALLYANRIPERFSPGRFDYIFASHQIFHTCVVLALLAHYESVLVALEYRMLKGVCPSAM